MHLGRQALDLGEPLPPLRCDLENNNVDMHQQQWDLLLARESQIQAPEVRLLTPWGKGYSLLDRFACNVSQQSKRNEEYEADLDLIWGNLSRWGMSGLQIIAGRYGVEIFNSIKWKNRLVESINTCIGKQPEHFTLQDHWLSQHALCIPSR